MNRYSIPLEEETLTALQDLSAGVVSIGFAKAHPHFKTCQGCFLQTPAGRWIELYATGQDLDVRFEVFTLTARVVDAPRLCEQRAILLPAPLKIMLLETESWLDPSAPIAHPTLGDDPIMQRYDRPGSTPETATVSCRYLGGVELTTANGDHLVIATAIFPYDMHVSGYYEAKPFDRDWYREWREV